MNNLKERSIRDEDLQEMVRRYKDGDREALKEILTDTNVKRMIEVLSVQNEIPEHGLTDEDMLGYIYLAIMEKIDQYDEDKSNLLTFIYIVANSACVSAVQRFSHEIKVPQKHHRVLTKIHKAEEKLWGKLERDPTLGELAEEVKMTVEELDELRTDMLAPEQYSHHSCEEYDGDRWENVAADVERPDSSFAAGGLGRQEWLEHFEELGEPAKTVMDLRYFHERSFPEIAKFLDMTPQYIRKVHDRSLEKLRNIVKK